MSALRVLKYSAVLAVAIACLFAAGVQSQCAPSKTGDTIPANPVIAGLPASITGSIGSGCSEEVDVITMGSYPTVNTYVNGGQSSSVITWPRANCAHLQPGLITLESLYPSLSAGQSVNIQSGSVLLRQCALPPGGGVLYRISVQSGATLVFDDADIDLNVREIYVANGGAILAGTDTCRLYGNIKITFHGSKAEATQGNTIAPADNPVLGTQLFETSKGMISNGVTEFHGKQFHPTWTRLAKKVYPGQDIIYVQDNVNWEVGQQIVIITSILLDCPDEYAAAWCKPCSGNCAPQKHQNEYRTIKALKMMPQPGAGEPFYAIQLNAGVSFAHYAGREYQTEVALLSRRIQFVGLQTNDRFGAHTRVQGNGEGRFSGVRCENCGQLNVVGRYPFHFHLMGDLPGASRSYIQDSVVANSGFRGFVVHGTNATRLSRNIAFNCSGMTYYLEDGVEERNLLEFNMAAHIHPIYRPADGGGGQNGEQFLTIQGTGPIPDLFLPADTTASGFYILNAANRFIGNAASGGWSGFAFPNAIAPFGFFKGTLPSDSPWNPASRPLTQFYGNSAHSSGFYWDSGHGPCVYVGGWLDYSGNTIRYISGRTSTTGSLSRTTIFPNKTSSIMVFEHTKLFLCNKGFSHWGSTVEIRHAEIYDTRVSAMLFGEATMYDVIVNARTPNLAKNWIAGQSVMGFQFYDTSVKSILSNCTFRNFSRVLGDYAIRYMDHSDHYTPQGINAVTNLRFEDVSFDTIIGIQNCGPLCGPSHNTMSAKIYSVWDVDGSLTGLGKPMLVGSTQTWWNNNDPSCTFNSQWKVYQCDWTQRKTIVYLQPYVEKLMDGCDYQAFGGPGANTCTDQFANYTVGRLMHWGPPNGNGIDIGPWAGVSGISNTGWHWRVNASIYGIDGAPSKFRVGPSFQMRKGTFVVLTINYPPQTTFVVKIIQQYWPGNPEIPPIAMAANLNIVLNDTEPVIPFSRFTQAGVCPGSGSEWWRMCKNVGAVGPQWYFDSAAGLLYLRVVPLACYNINSGINTCDTNTYTKWGASVPGITGGLYYEVTATCPTCTIQSSLGNINYYSVANQPPATPFPTNWGTNLPSPGIPTPKPRNAFQCPAPTACAPGYSGTPQTGCVDINECAIANGGCATNTVPQTVCTNTPGSRTCGSPVDTCATGWTGDGVTCTDTNECTSNNGGCSTNPLISCFNTVGSRTCGTCPSGYTTAGPVCNDINECAVNNGGCSQVAGCSNSQGSYACGSCPSGYTGTSGNDCQDINECATTNGGCDPLQPCTNSGGSYSCGTCPTGYTTSGNTCTDIDECLVGNGGCDPLAACQNVGGGRTCGSCPAGYSGTGSTSCLNINECLTNYGGCDTRTTCTDADGTYSCSACPAGYHSSSGDGKTACIQDSVSDPCASITCQNGGTCNSGTCTCTAGYTGSVCQTSPVITSVALTPVSPGVKQIGWSSTGSLSTVLIKFYKTGNSVPVAFITESASNANSFVWTIPPAVRLLSGTYYVRVVFSAYPAIGASSADLTVDGCTFAPCLNGGACSATNSECTCNSGYAGTSCENDLCATVTCQNGGACDRAASASSGVATCTCPSGFTGSFCESAASCGMSCGHGGMIQTCSSCSCVSGSYWQGATCNTCELNALCSNGGTATAACDKCTCPFTFSGVTCRDYSLCLNLRLSLAYATAVANPTQFATAFRNDVALALGISTTSVSQVTTSPEGSGTLVFFCLASNISANALTTLQSQLAAQLTNPSSPLLAGDTTSAVDATYGVPTASDPNSGGGSSDSGFLSGNMLYYLIAAAVGFIAIVATIGMAVTKRGCFSPSGKESPSPSVSNGTASNAVEFTPPKRSPVSEPLPAVAVVVPEPAAAAYEAPAAAAAAAPAAAPAAASASDWTEQVTADGNRYYWNSKSGESSWTRPAEMDVPTNAAVAKKAPPPPPPRPARATPARQ